MQRNLRLFPQLSGAAQGNIPALSSLSIHPLPAQHEPKHCFTHFEVAGDEASNLEDQMEDGSEFDPTEKHCIASKVLHLIILFQSVSSKWTSNLCHPQI